VGNLSYDAHEGDLEELFTGAGNVVDAEVVTNSRTQQSKGFAFVEMGTVAEAIRAVEILDDQDFMGRRLRINGARSEGPRDPSPPERSEDVEASPEIEDHSSKETVPSSSEPPSGEISEDEPAAMQPGPTPVGTVGGEAEGIPEPPSAHEESPEEQDTPG